MICCLSVPDCWFLLLLVLLLLLLCVSTGPAVCVQHLHGVSRQPDCSGQGGAHLLQGQQQLTAGTAGDGQQAGFRVVILSYTLHHKLQPKLDGMRGHSTTCGACCGR